MSTVLVIMVLPFIIVALLFLGDYILKRIIKPNQKYLEETEKLKFNKIANGVNLIVIFILLFTDKYSIRASLLIGIVTIIESIRNKKIYDYLKSKKESESTKKYIVINYILFLIAIILLNIYYLYR